jgi:DNA-binding beta-propeller fold protein YncE
VGSRPYGVVFDGYNIWVANYLANKITKLRTSDGAILATFEVGYAPWDVAFDGTKIWVTNYLGDTVSRR